MKATIPFIRERFEQFNAQMFGGQLPQLSIRLSHARTFVGMCTFKRHRLLSGGMENYDFKLQISTQIDLSECELEDTIIHEMIHYYIGVHQWRDTSEHGRLFRQMMNDINERFGRQVSVLHQSTKTQREQTVDKVPHYHVVAVVRFKDGRVGIRCCRGFLSAYFIIISTLVRIRMWRMWCCIWRMTHFSIAFPIPLRSKCIL